MRDFIKFFIFGVFFPILLLTGCSKNISNIGKDIKGAFLQEEKLKVAVKKAYITEETDAKSKIIKAVNFDDELLVIGLKENEFWFKVLTPKNLWRIAEEKHIESDMSLIKAWSPYVIVIVLLILTRVIPALTGFTQNFMDLSLSNILDTGLSSSWQLLYSPGTILIFVSVIAFLLQGSIKDFGETAKISFKTIVGAILTLIPTLIMVQIFSNSAMNTAGLDSMPVYLAKELGVVLNPIWVFVAPYLGELGSFIAGSATVSALTFSPIQLQIATDYGMNYPLILSLGVMGGAAGNMICVHNVVSVAAVVKCEGKEGSIIRKTVVPALLYAFLLGLSATLLF